MMPYSDEKRYMYMYLTYMYLTITLTLPVYYMVWRENPNPKSLFSSRSSLTKGRMSQEVCCILSIFIFTCTCKHHSNTTYPYLLGLFREIDISGKGFIELSSFREYLEITLIEKESLEIDPRFQLGLGLGLGCWK